MFKQELPLLFPSNQQLQEISASIMDPFEYLLMLHDRSELSLDFKSTLGEVFYQVACHPKGTKYRNGNEENFGINT